MKLTQKAKRAIRNVCQDVFMEAIKDEHYWKEQYPPDMWDADEKERWDKWDELTSKLEVEIIKRIEGS